MNPDELKRLKALRRLGWQVVCLTLFAHLRVDRATGRLGGWPTVCGRIVEDPNGNILAVGVTRSRIMVTCPTCLEKMADVETVKERRLRLRALPR